MISREAYYILQCMASHEFVLVCTREAYVLALVSLSHSLLHMINPNQISYYYAWHLMEMTNAPTTRSPMFQHRISLVALYD